jgi:hypothetical protein
MNAKPKHQKEELEIILFWKKNYWKTGFAIKRCYIKLFKYFEKKPFGITFEGVQIIIRHKNEIILGKFDELRQRTHMCEYDLGAAGMVCYGTSYIKSAQDELYEECGLKNKITHKMTLSPSDGVNCLIHIFECEIKDTQELKSDDGTFLSFISMSKTRALNANMKSDARIILNKYEL